MTTQSYVDLDKSNWKIISWQLLSTIESCYTDTYNRYKNYVEKMEAAFADIEIMKKVIAEHSEKLQKLA